MHIIKRREGRGNVFFSSDTITGQQQTTSVRGTVTIVSKVVACDIYEAAGQDGKIGFIL